MWVYRVRWTDFMRAFFALNVVESIGSIPADGLPDSHVDPRLNTRLSLQFQSRDAKSLTSE
jgi:hypothetical protein